MALPRKVFMTSKQCHALATLVYCCFVNYMKFALPSNGVIKTWWWLRSLWRKTVPRPSNLGLVLFLCKLWILHYLIMTAFNNAADPERRLWQCHALVFASHCAEINEIFLCLVMTSLNNGGDGECINDVKTMPRPNNLALFCFSLWSGLNLALLSNDVIKQCRRPRKAILTSKYCQRPINPGLFLFHCELDEILHVLCRNLCFDAINYGNNPARRLWLQNSFTNS